MLLKDKYFLKVKEVKIRRGWSNREVEVYRRNEEGTEVKISEYNRNYPSFFNTFCAFTKNGKDYALISDRYSELKILDLTTGKIIATQPDSNKGFCPVDFYVPTEDNPNLSFAFVAGCVWGDDSSWKVQYVDLSKIEEGVVTTDDRFGYIELATNIGLEDAVTIVDTDLDGSEFEVQIATPALFRAKPDGTVTEMLDRGTFVWKEPPEITKRES